MQCSANVKKFTFNKNKNLLLPPFKKNKIVLIPDSSPEHCFFILQERSATEKNLIKFEIIKKEQIKK